MATNLKKSPKAIINMRKAGNIVAKCFENLEQYLRPSISTKEVDTIIEDFLLSNGAIPSFKGYKGFPSASCISLNDVVVHGIPSESELINEGDLVSIDIGAYINGYHGDAARTYIIGRAGNNAQKLVDVTKQSFFCSLDFAKEGYRICDISKAIMDYVESFGLSVVREMVGHGIGKKLHEPPSIPNFVVGEDKNSLKIEQGFCLAIEPMVNIGSYRIKICSDGWTAKTMDGSLSAHYENTILITDGEPEILTLL